MKSIRPALPCLALGLLALTGCMRLALNFPPPDQALICHSVNPVSRKHLYVALVDGIDLTGTANLGGLRYYLHKLGFTKTIYGCVCHAHFFDGEFSKIAQHDPAARLVIIGHGLGEMNLPRVVGSAEHHGLPIDLIILSEPGCGCETVYEECEAGCVRLVRVGPVKYPQVVDRIAMELAAVARSIPVVHMNQHPPGVAPGAVPGSPGRPGHEVLPAPRPHEELPRPRNVNDVMKETGQPGLLKQQTRPLASEGWDALEPADALPDIPALGVSGGKSSEAAAPLHPGR